MYYLKHLRVESNNISTLVLTNQILIKLILCYFCF